MRIKFPEKQDARSWKGMSGHAGDVIDLDTGERVGYIQIHQGFWIGTRRSHTRSISMMDGKYQGSFDTHDECYGFAKGIEAVINHLVAPSAKKSKSEAA
jgi:hypothetical protein